MTLSLFVPTVLMRCSN